MSKFILVYKNKKKEIEIPDNYSEFLNIFLKEFNEDKNKTFEFNTEDENGSDRYIEDDDTFQEVINDLDENPIITINIKEEKNTNYNEKKDLNNRDLSNIPGNKVNKSNDNNIENISCQDEKKIIKELIEKNKKIKNQMNRLNSIINQKNKKLHEKQKLLKDSENEINTLKKEIENKEKTIKEQESTIKNNVNYKNVIEKYKPIIKKINEYKKQVEEYKSKIQKNDEYEKQIKEYKSEIDKSKLIQNKQKSEIEKYKSEIDKSKLIQNKQKKEIEKYKSEIEKIKLNLINNEQKQEELLKKSNQKEENLNFLIVKTKHKGIKCDQCFKEPIIGFRYKCSQCQNYNLCEVCEDNNAVFGYHPHDFIKIRKEQKNNNTIINNNKIQINEQNKDKEIITNKNKIVNNNQIIEDTIIILNEDVKKDYSYECLNILNLSSYIYEGVNETKVDIILKNNGNKEWPKNTKLSFQKKSEIKGNNLLLDSQSPGQQKQYSFYFNNIGEYSPKEYKLFYLFNINGENLGEEIIVRINIIKQKEKIKNELNEYSDQIKEFRDAYGIGNDIEDEKILRLFKETNFNYEASFDKLFE